MTAPRSGSFADILSRLERTVAPLEGDPPAVVEAVRAFRDALPRLDNVGRSGDVRDVYFALDRLIESVRASYPGTMCKAGCSGCCESDTAVFDASATEWRLIEELIDTWPEADRRALAERFARDHAPHVPGYRLLGAIHHFEPVSDRFFATRRYRCPFLVDGRCSVYEARPLACRMYGHFAIRTRWYRKPGIYACREQTDYFHATRDQEGLTLPTVNMLSGRIRRLFKGRARILPLWLARWVKARGLDARTPEG